MQLVPVGESAQPRFWIQISALHLTSKGTCSSAIPKGGCGDGEQKSHGWAEKVLSDGFVISERCHKYTPGLIFVSWNCWRNTSQCLARILLPGSEIRRMLNNVTRWKVERGNRPPPWSPVFRWGSKQSDLVVKEYTHEPSQEAPVQWVVTYV